MSTEGFTMPTLTDECIEVAYSAIRIRGLWEQLRNEEWDAMAHAFGEEIRNFALNLVDQELARRDEEKLRMEKL